MSTYNKQHQQSNMSIAAQITQYNKSKNCRKPEVKIDTITDKKNHSQMYLYLWFYDI